MPVVVMRPPVVASPNACVSRSNSPHVTPPAARAVRASGSTQTPFIGDRSITIPSSHDGVAGDAVAAAPDGDLEAAARGRS